MSQPLPRYIDPDPDEWERKLAAILIDVGEAAPPASSFHTMIADTQLLRGIPVVGAVSGTSPGTDPLHALLHNDR